MGLRKCAPMRMSPEDFDADVIEGWTHCLMDCAIRFMGAGEFSWRCGYVMLPEGHPWVGLGYDEIHVGVFGGVTFAGWVGERYAIGFDTAHYFGDRLSRSDVKAETEYLAEQAFDALLTTLLAGEES